MGLLSRLILLISGPCGPFHLQHLACGLARHGHATGMGSGISHRLQSAALTATSRAKLAFARLLVTYRARSLCLTEILTAQSAAHPSTRLHCLLLGLRHPPTASSACLLPNRDPQCTELNPSFHSLALPPHGTPSPPHCQLSAALHLPALPRLSASPAPALPAAPAARAAAPQPAASLPPPPGAAPPGHALPAAAAVSRPVCMYTEYWIACCLCYPFSSQGTKSCRSKTVVAEAVCALLTNRSMHTLQL